MYALIMCAVPVLCVPGRSGADKVSIGSDAVEVAEEYTATKQLTGKTSIEQISSVYGRQAVVVSVDPRRVWVSDPSQVIGGWLVGCMSVACRLGG